VIEGESSLHTASRDEFIRTIELVATESGAE
jgi:hypothetical protein